MAGNGSPHPQSAEVHQAQGMVSVQAKCSLADALMIMVQLAADTDETVDVVAAAVVDGTVRLD